MAGPLGSCSAAARKAAATRACSLVLARPRHELWDAGNGSMEGGRRKKIRELQAKKREERFLEMTVLMIVLGLCVCV